jgi:hypothetical protein
VGSPLFEEILNKDGGLKLNLPKIIESVRAIHEKRGTSESTRGTMHENFGHGDQNCDNDLPPGTSGMSCNFPEMTNMGSNSLPEHKHLYKAVGDVANKAALFLRMTQSTEQFPMNSKRHRMAGMKLAKHMGAMHSPWEAFTISVTMIGHLIMNADGTHTLIMELVFALMRHIDGPNDGSKGCDVTVVFWIICVDNKLNVWRTSFVFCSRKCVKDAEKREDCTRPAEEECILWMKHVMGPDLSKVCLDTFDERDKDTFELGQLKWTVFRTIPHGDPMALWSLITWTILCLKGDFPMMGSKDSRRLLELLMLVLRCNSSITCHLVVKRWRKSGENPLEVKDGKIVGPNFIRRHCEECRSLDFEPKNAKMNRHQHSERGEHQWLGAVEEEDDIMEAEFDKLKETLDLANGLVPLESGKLATNLEVIRRLDTLEEISQVKSLGFCRVGVFTGLLHTNHAKRQSLEQPVAAGSAWVGCLKEIHSEHFGSDSDRVVAEKATTMAKRFGHNWEQPGHVAENVGCKLGRAKKKGGSKERLLVKDLVQPDGHAAP